MIGLFVRLTKSIFRIMIKQASKATQFCLSLSTRWLKEDRMSQQVRSSKLSRRQFLQGGAALGAVGLLTLAGCAPPAGAPAASGGGAAAAPAAAGKKILYW